LNEAEIKYLRAPVVNNLPAERMATERGSQLAAAAANKSNQETKTLQAFPNCPIRAESIFADKVIFPLPGRLNCVIIQKTAYNSLVCL